MSSSPHALHDEHDDHTRATHDATMDEVEVTDHGFVDMLEFGFLVSRTAALEQNLSALNENVTKMTDLLQQLVRQQASGVPVTPMAAGGAVEPTSAGLSQGAEAQGPLGSQEVATRSKNQKPPVYRGEERERNKDAVNIFLHKWGDLHALRHTPDSICALETSLNLEGKAYKWWMSLDVRDRPTTWAKFEEIFRKEFLPENEKERNWTAWDKCRMDNLTLSQYVAKYREIILKLDGLDDFQKVRGFIRGLDNEYKAKVKTQYPKTLEEAIQSAQIFDDTLDPSSKASARGKSHAFNNGGKRKFNTFSKETTNDKQDHTKKPKGARGPLSSDELARARREKLCFHCLGSHERRHCPLLKGNEPDKAKGKEKAVHMAQVLPLDACPKYSAVQVNYQAPEHECCLTASPWQQTVGPHDLLRLHGTINGRRVRVLVDDGSTHNFLNYTLVKKLRLPQDPSTHSYVVSLMNGSDKDVWDTEVRDVSLELQGHTMKLDFHVMHMTRADVVLGRNWLFGLGSSLSRSYQHNTLAFEDNGVHVLLIGERDVPPSPLICTAEVQVLAKRNEIEEAYFCYVLSPFLSANDCVVDNVLMESNMAMTTPSLSSKESSSASHASHDPLSFSTSHSHHELHKLLKDYEDVFPSDLPAGLPPERDVMHGIDLIPGSKPISKPPYRLSAVKLARWNDN